MFNTFYIFIVMLLIIGFYYIIATRNLIRVLIGLEILIKSVCLAIILAGYIIGNTALAQSLVITVIIIEVAIIAVAAGIILGIYRSTDSLSTKNLRNLKG